MDIMSSWLIVVDCHTASVQRIEIIIIRTNRQAAMGYLNALAACAWFHNEDSIVCVCVCVCVPEIH